MISIRSISAALLLLAVAWSCKSDDPTGSVDPVADLDSLTVRPGSVPADGRTVTVVRAIIPSASRVLPRQVTFTTSAGTFLPQGSAAQTNVVVPVDAAGVAVALLQAPVNATLASVTARAGETTLQDTVRFHQPLADLTAFEIAADSVVADDVTTAVVRATLRRESTVTPRAVTFETTTGVFVSSNTTTITVPTDTSGTAVALLRASQEPGTAIVRAKAGNAVLQETLRFVTAYPESIVLSADSFRIGASAGKSLKLQANLLRSTGRVSRGATVTFVPVDSTGTQEVGWFSGVLETSPGVVQAVYTPGETPYRGRVDVIARTPGAGGTVVQAALRLQVTDP